MQIRRTLAKIEGDIRPPLRVRTSATVVSATPGAATTPFGYEFDTDGTNDRLVQTIPLRTSASLNGKAEPAQTGILAQGAVVAGIHSPSASVMGRNPRYVFGLERGKVSDCWLLTFVGKADESSVTDADKILTQRREEAIHPANLLSLLDGAHQLETLFQADGFKLINASQDNRNGLVTIDSTRSFRGLPGAIIECKYIFDPTSGWLPVSWSEKVSAPQRDQSLTSSRKLTVTGKKYESDITTTNNIDRPEKGSVTRKSLHTVEAVNRIPEAEFTLPAFGLPEPPGFEAPRTPLYVWLLGLAALCFALTVGFRLLARRRAKA